MQEKLEKELFCMKCYVSFQVLLCRVSQIHISGHRMGVSLYYLSSYSYSFLLPFLGGFQGTTMYHPPALWATQWYQTFSNFSCMFLNPNIFFQFEFKLFWFIRYLVLAFHCLNNLFQGTQWFWKFLAFSLEFQSFSRSLEQFFLTVGQNCFGNKISFPNYNKHFFQRNYKCLVNW